MSRQTCALLIPLTTPRRRSARNGSSESTFASSFSRLLVSSRQVPVKKDQRETQTAEERKCGDEGQQPHNQGLPGVTAWGESIRLCVVHLSFEILVNICLGLQNLVLHKQLRPDAQTDLADQRN